MPILPENKKLYPVNWPEIRTAIKQRAKNKCEFCGVENYAVGFWEENKFTYVGGNAYVDCLEYTKSYKEACEIRDCENEYNIYDGKFVVIVLTIAHLDHDPTNNDPINLRALCQHCHNRYDRKHRNETQKNRKLKGQLKLF